MVKANIILVDYLDKATERLGKPEAVEGLKSIIDKGVTLLVELPPEKLRNRYVRKVVRMHQEGGADTVVEEVAADVADHYKAKSGKFLPAVMVENTLYRFLPDVEIPATSDEAEKWAGFLALLEPAKRTGFDPRTRLAGRIPFRDGSWHQDVHFRPGLPLAVVSDVRDVRGSLKVSSPKCATRHRFVVRGELEAPVELLAGNESPVAKLGGSLRLFGAKLKEPPTLPLSPQTLVSWGVVPGKTVSLSDTTAYEFQMLKKGTRKTFVLSQVRSSLAPEASGPRLYEWSGDRWKRMAGELDPEVLAEVQAKLGKIKVYLGLGPDFVQDDKARLEDNIRRLIALFDFFLGVHLPGRRTKLRDEDQLLVTGIRENLERLGLLLQLDGADQEKLEKSREEITSLLEDISDEQLRSLQKALTRRLILVDENRVRADQDYLLAASRDQASLSDILGNAGNTVVFLNNVLTSREARTKVAGLIATPRRYLREMFSTREAERLLVSMLKTPDQDHMKGLRQAHPDKTDVVDKLAKSLATFSGGTPLDVINELIHAEYPEQSKELLMDRALLHKLAVFDHGSVDDLFSWRDEDGAVHYDVDQLRNALWVNLKSFLVGDIRRKETKMERMRPRQLVFMLLDRVEELMPVIRVYNSLAVSR